ncbi:MAG: class I SAM-dependent methyltransferase [Gemmatimonadota bacterium]|nr:class I SAM-dependent methyltransferase [Gemmatimonadota bacterium]MDH3367542.1 class I SAM-dependent methyltransferase [Gemmatimonadota bacterium]MDH3479406.1 class I SAM-dependent methyltransferase [Gemmatimonadota bacterium]MDH3569669.1 class I SAM-dependent methyltransferase [Gemmatimonadota bacterium]MDH5551136.1 class I SAM-dependent methyltransferase [Gemmatimonadota bacterium]
MREGLVTATLVSVYDRVAARYDLQHGLLTAHSDQRGRRLVVAKAVREADTILDCGAGTGSSALLAARRAGARGRVTLFDLSRAMLHVARERAEAASGTAPMTFGVGDLLHLPFADGTFDVALSTYSLCPVSDPVRGALEMFRVVKPGGRIGIAHSAEPRGALRRWLADKVESLVWRFPSISLGCRSVAVLPALKQAGARLRFEAHIGIPLWPFAVFVLEKPAA